MSTTINFDENNVQQRRSGNSQSYDDQSTPQQQQQPFNNLFNQTMASTMGAYVFNTGKEKAQQALNIYSHIDYLRPYFDVEPKDVLNRLLYSLVPVDPNSLVKLPTELYGPLMILFTLCAILIYQMKMANQSVQDGTLIGTAFFGYALFSHCVVLFVGTFLHTSFDHFIFYFLWLFLSGAASLKLAYILFLNTQVTNYKIPLAAGIVVVHMSFLLYLHFAYHELAEEVSHALFDKLDNVPAQLAEAVTKSIGEAASKN